MVPDHDGDKYWHDDCGHAIVVNKCPYDVWLWSVGHDTDGPYRIGCGEQYIEKYNEDGVALELVKDKHDWHKDQNKLIFYYKLYGGEVLYDIYGKQGHPFGGHKIRLKPEDPTCPRVTLDNGTTYSSQFYNI